MAAQDLPNPRPYNLNQAARLVQSLTAASISTCDSKTYVQYLTALKVLYAANKITSLVPILPLYITLKGKPMHLAQHFVMEPVYSLQTPIRTVYKTARQVSKSTGLAASRILHSAIKPHFSSLYIAPLYVQTTRFSTLVLRPMLRSSPIRHILVKGNNVLDNVLQLQMSNGSVQHFSFAFHDAERIRGISASSVDIDEIQDLNPEFIDVIESTMDASDWGVRRYFGTPKTSDNHIQTLFDESSGGEWVTPCSGCRRDNIATVSHHLMDMIQEKGPSCYHCGKLLDPATGHFQHARPERRPRFAGYHVPQVVMPFHYANSNKWYELFIAKTKMSPVRFLNEKLGESCDVMSTLISRQNLMDAAVLPWSNADDDGKTLQALAARYPVVTLGVDWGGYGASGVSFTALVLLGHLPDGKIDVLRMRRITQTTGNSFEATKVLELASKGRISKLGHDYNGAGGVRETLLIQAGFPLAAIVPLAYTGNTTQAMVTYQPPGVSVIRGYYRVDKPRAVTMVAELIRTGVIRFPKFDSWNVREGDIQSLADDFLAVTEDRVDLDRSSSVLVIRKKPGRTDDILHALIYGALAYWQSEQRYPDIAFASGVQITAEQQEKLSPTSSLIDWGD